MLKIINSLHLTLIIFLCMSIFIDDNRVKHVALVLLIYMLLQYITNYGRCGLTELEYMIKGEKYKEGFLYNLINPVITVSETYFNKSYYCVHILWIIILWIQLKKPFIN